MTEQIPLEALKKDTGVAFLCKTDLKCPHCGTVYSTASNDAWELYDAAKDHTVECLRCELSFLVVVNVKYSFTTEDRPDYDE